MKPELNRNAKDASFRADRIILSALLAILCMSSQAVAQDEPLYFHLKNGRTLHTHLVSVRDSSILIYRGSHTTYSMVQDTVNIKQLQLKNIDSVTLGPSRSGNTASGAFVGGLVGCVVGVGFAALATDGAGDVQVLSVLQNMLLVAAGVGGAVVGALIGGAAANSGSGYGSCIYIENGNPATLRKFALIHGEEPAFLKRYLPEGASNTTPL